MCISRLGDDAANALTHAESVRDARSDSTPDARSDSTQSERATPSFLVIDKILRDLLFYNRFRSHDYMTHTT